MSPVSTSVYILFCLGNVGGDEKKISFSNLQSEDRQPWVPGVLA